AEIANTPDDVDTLTAVTSSGIRCSDDSVTHKRRTLSSTMHWNVGSFGTIQKRRKNDATSTRRALRRPILTAGWMGGS
ncbi:hypothetical protein V1478_006709, partial [Vespula squamosa]